MKLVNKDDDDEFFLCYDPCVFMANNTLSFAFGSFFFLHNHMGIKHTYIYTHTHTCLPKLLLEDTIQASRETL